MTTPLLPSGTWHGTFAYSALPDSDTLTRFELECLGEEIHGRGRDVDGSYTLRGNCDPSGKVRWTKEYAPHEDDPEAPATVVAYLGTWDTESRALAGRWRIVNGGTHGRFALKPGEPPAGLVVPEQTPATLLAKITAKLQAQCTIDLEAVRFDGERAMLASLLADPDFVEAMQGASVAAELATTPRGQERSFCVRLERAVMPRLFAVLDRCVEALGLKIPVSLFVVNDGGINANVVPPTDTGIEIAFTSGLLNVLDDDEIAYVIGHEIGHALLGHHATTVTDATNLSGVTNLRRLALSRYQELSADRVGLLCCPDVAKAVRAEFILLTGIVGREGVGTAEAILSAATSAVERGVVTKATDPAAGLDTHPYGPMRTLAIDWFGRSSTFYALRGGKGGEISESELESRVQQIVDLMNPTIFGHTAAADEVAELVALTALSIADADNGISDEEDSAIRGMSDDIAAAYERAASMPLEEQQLRSLELAEKLSLLLPPALRKRLVEDLVMIAQVDGEVSAAEADALAAISSLLGVGMCATFNVLDELNAGLD